MLAKNYLAKACNIVTGEALWQARQKCPNLTVLTPNYERYLEFSRLSRLMFQEYTDKVEPFGLDEAWLDVTGDRRNGHEIADEIRERVKDELGITASVGVSYNKIFAKLGSDVKKPDATTVITEKNFRSVVWNLTSDSLLYVGPSTKKKLARVGMFSIGDIATSEPSVLKGLLGKNGLILWNFANGYDESPVSQYEESAVIKSIGNSITTPRDLICEDDVKMVVYLLSESVAARLRKHGFRAGTVQIHVRDNGLFSFQRQAKLNKPTQLANEIEILAMKVFHSAYDFNCQKPIRSFGVRASNLTPANGIEQLSFLPEDIRRGKIEQIEHTVDEIRGRFGRFSIQRGIMLIDKGLTSINPKDEHVIHPVAFLNGK